MNKNDVYKALGVIECALMMKNDTIPDYVLDMFMFIQEYVDKSHIAEPISTKPCEGYQRKVSE